MKKFLGLLAVVCTATTLSAASITWGVWDQVYDNTGSTFDSGSAFLFIVPTQSSVLPSYATNGTWNLGDATLVTSKTFSGADGWVDATSTVDYKTFYKTDSFYVTILTTTSATDINNVTDGYYVVTELAQLADGGSTDPDNIAASEGEIWFSINKEWQSTNVPEPTVLALLALGVAGVALRRKKMA